MKTTTEVRNLAKIEELTELTDEVKDSIDDLVHGISSPKRRLEVARDLAEYIHFLDYPDTKRRAGRL